jgi:ATP-binding cassette subfamily F protein 3
MLKIDNMSKSYGRHVLFDKVGLMLNPGERVGLVGRNGHGKTTIFRMILGQEEPDEGVVSLPKRYTVGHLSQHIKFTEDTVIKEVCLALPKHEDGTDETYKAAAVLHGLGIETELFERHPSELSGGYQIRLNLAKALCSEPNLLLLDEPTNYLDIISLRWLKTFLRNWPGELMLITHDRGFMDSVTTHTIAIHRHKIRKIAGPTEKLYAQLELEEEIHENTRVNEEKIRKEAEAYINRFRAQATKASSVQSRIKALEKRGTLDKLDRIRTLDFEFTSAPFQSKEMLKLKSLSFGFTPDEPPLFENLSISVGKNERIAVIGKNGKGKTTLLNLIAGELRPVSGSIECHDNLKIAYFGQTNVARLSPEKTVEQEIMFAHKDENRGVARRICGAMMFSGDDALKKINVLSGGEKSRVLLGKILATPANLLLLDEPTNHLDMHSVDALSEAVDAFDGSVIIVTHSEALLKRMAKRLIVFDEGKASLFDGTYDEFLERSGWSDDGEKVEKEADDWQAPTGAFKGLSKKQARKLRAELLENRSKVITPLKKRVSAIEDEITRFEVEAARAEAALVAACEKNSTADIATLSKAQSAALKSIDTLFAELELANAELEEQTRRLNADVAENA